MAQVRVWRPAEQWNVALVCGPKRGRGRVWLSCCVLRHCAGIPTLVTLRTLCGCVAVKERTAQLHVCECCRERSKGGKGDCGCECPRSWRPPCWAEHSHMFAARARWEGLTLQIHWAVFGRLPPTALALALALAPHFRMPPWERSAFASFAQCLHWHWHLHWQSLHNSSPQAMTQRAVLLID